jgi:PAS domain S-box-containing protein
MNMQSHPIRVLLIGEDEEDYIVVRHLLSELFSKEFILKWISDYGAALDAILSCEFDVCLLDYRLKDRNGLELMQEAVRRGAMTPIVFLTGQGDPDPGLEAMSKGAADWLTKGELSGSLLERSIRYTMERQRLRRSQMQAEESLKEAYLDLERRVAERTAEMTKVNAELGGEAEERGQAEKALRESEARLRQIIDLVPHKIFVKSCEGKYLLVNKAVAETYNTSVSNLTGKHQAAFHPDERELERILQDDREVITKGKTKFIADEPFTDAQGNLRLMQTTKVPFHIFGDAAPAVLGVAIDITDSKRAEEALRGSEAKYRLISENTGDVIWQFDLDTDRFVYVSPSVHRLTGFTPEEVVGQNMEAMLTSESMQHVSKRLPEVIAALNTGDESVRVTTHEVDQLRKDGSAVSVEVVTTALQDAAGRVVGIIGVSRDISQRKLAEIALRESEERFSRFFHATPVGTSITRLKDGQYVDVNDAHLSLLGYTREEIIGRNVSELGIWAYPEDRAKMVEILQNQGRIRDFETKFRMKSGKIRDVSLSSEQIALAGQQYVLGLTHDITERKRGEEERRRLQEQLFQAQKMESVGRLAGGVAHDFNNMLGVIIGWAEMSLNMDITADGLRHNLQEILKAGLRSADLTRQLLAFARKQTADPKVLDLNDTISGMLKMLRRLIGADIDLIWHPGADLWKVKIDPSQVDQILANLVVNARDAISGAGAVTMRTENAVVDDSHRAETPEFIPGEYVLVTVSDSGEGMSKDVCKKIFEPFFTTKEVGKGTGLGLSTVYGIVKQNLGFIYVASEPGKGTTFKIYLPRFEGETAQVYSEEAAGGGPTGTETILLVEDDEAILYFSKTTLQTLGYTVIESQTPAYAIHLVEEHPEDIHLVITDVVLPEMNGRELAQQLSAIRPSLKCLYMSGYTADVITHRGILDKGVNFIQKPFGSDDLAAKVRQVLDYSK